MRRRALYPIALLLLCADGLDAQGQKIPNMTRGDLPSYVEVEESITTTCAEGGIWIANGASVVACSPWTWLATGECIGANGGALTINASNQVVCSDDDAGTPFTPNVDPGVDHSGYVAGHGDGANCSAGNYPLGVDAAGAVQSCTADDDVPEVGDYTNLVAGRSLTAPTVGTLDADPELYERTITVNIDPSHPNTDWIVYRMERAATIIGIDCLVEGATSVVLTLRECNSNGASCTDSEAAMTCGTTLTSEAGGIDDAALDAGDIMRVLRGTVTGSPTQAVMFITFQVTD